MRLPRLGSVFVDEQRDRLERELALLQKERGDLAAQFTRDKHSVLTLHNELNEGVRPLTAEWLRSGMELLTRLHETSARLVELDALLASYRKQV